jgi:hypothetical protein
MLSAIKIFTSVQTTDKKQVKQATRITFYAD